MAAWCFDRVVHRFGSRVQHELQQAAREAKNDSQARTTQQRVLYKWFGREADGPTYKDPAASNQADTIATSDKSGPVVL